MGRLGSKFETQSVGRSSIDDNFLVKLKDQDTNIRPLVTSS